MKRPNEPSENVTLSRCQLATIRRALDEIQSIIEATFAHEDDGERIDEPGENSAADIVEMLCNIELVVDQAVDVVANFETCDAGQSEAPAELPRWAHSDDDNDVKTMTCALCGKVELEHDAISGGWIPSYWIGDREVPNPACRRCATEKTKCLDGDSVLKEAFWPKRTLADLVEELKELTKEHEQLETDRDRDFDDRHYLLTDEQIDRRENEIFEACFEIAQDIVDLTR